MTLSPIGNAECFVNNVQVKIKHKISQGIFLFFLKYFYFTDFGINFVFNIFKGDFLTMGKNIFRFNHPEEAARLREKKKEQQSTERSRRNHCSLGLKSQSMPSLSKEPISLSLFALNKKYDIF